MGQSSSTNSQETSQTSYPQWTQDAQANTFQMGTGMLNNFLRNPRYSVAGFTPDALKGFDLARQTAQNVYTAPHLYAPDQTNLLRAATGTAAQGQAAQLAPGQISTFMNPYMQNVVDTTMASLGRERDKAAADIGARAAAGNAFGGGSGEALERAQLNRNFGEQASSTIAALMAAGYDKATATALANTQLQQQTGLANTGYQQQMGLANMAAENAMRTQGADYGLKATQLNDQFRTTAQARQLSALQQLLQGGVVQQAQAQRALDVPWTALERLAALTPRQLNSQTVSNKTSESESSNPIGAIQGILSGVGSLGQGAGSFMTGLAALSDKNEKTNIQEVGKDPQTGETLYAYDYKADVAAAKKSGAPMPPKRVSPMAQDIEKRDPSAVRTIGGKKVIVGR